MDSFDLRLKNISSSPIIIAKCEKYNYAEVKAVALALNLRPPSKQTPFKHPPRVSKKPQNCNKKPQTSSLFHLSKALCNQKVRQFPNPLLKELRRLVLNQIDSGDRLFRSLITEQHKAALQLYSQDRMKLIEYLNSLAIRQVNIDSIKSNLQKKSQGKDHKNGILGLQNFDLSAEANQTTRKRSKSEFPKDHKLDQPKMLKRKLKKIEKDWKQGQSLQVLENEKQAQTIGQAGNVLVQVKGILQQAMENNTLKENLVLFRKSEIEAIIYLLSHGMNQGQNIVNSKQIEEMKMQLQQKEQLIDQLNNHLQAKLKQVYTLQSQCKEHHSTHYEQLKQKVNYLYNQLSSLVSDAQVKDQLIQYLKSENQTLKTDIQGLQQMNTKAKQQQNALTQYFQSLQERLRQSEDQISRRQEQSNELRVELLHKDNELAIKAKQLRHLLANNQSLKQQSQEKIKDLERKFLGISDQKHLLELQREFSKSYVVKLEKKLTSLGSTLQSAHQAAQPAQNQDITLVSKNDINAGNPQENMVIVQGNKDENTGNLEENKGKHEKSEWQQRAKQKAYIEAEQILEVDLYTEQQHQLVTPLLRSLSIEVNQSNFPANENQIDFIGMNLQTPVKNKSQSLHQQSAFVAQRLLRHQDSDIQKVAKKSRSQKKNLETRTQMQDAYQSDDEGDLSSEQRDKKDTFKIFSLSKQLNHSKHQSKAQHQGKVQHQLPSEKQQNKPALQTKQSILKEVQEIEELEEHKAHKSETEIAGTHPIQFLGTFNNETETKPKVNSMQLLDQLKRTSIILNQQESNCKASEVPSKMSQSSSRTIFIKWPAKKLINATEGIQKLKNSSYS